MFYDLIPLFFQEKYFSNLSSKVEYVKNLMISSQYKSLFSISLAALNEFKYFVKNTDQKLYVTGAGISDDYLNKTYLKSKYELPFKRKEYFIMVGGGDG